MKKFYLCCLTTIFFTNLSYGQWTTGNNISNTNLGNVGIGTVTPNAKLDVYGDGIFMGALQVGNAEVNTNTTKLFINNRLPSGKNWALSSGANNITQAGFHIYNWTDAPGTPLFSIANDGAVSVNNVTGGTLTLQKSSTNIPSLVFQGAASATTIEGGDAYLTAYVGGNRRLTVLSNGHVGIGTIFPQEELSVNGSIRAKEIKVETTNWPDYVFDQDYNLISLKELDLYLQKNKHLPEMPSAAEIELNGLNLGEMNSKLLKNVEELTLHLIEKDKQVQQQLKMMEAQDQRIIKLENMMIDVLKKVK